MGPAAGSRGGSAVYAVHCTVHTLLYTLHTLLYTVHTLQCTVHTLLCTLYNLRCTLNFTLYVVLYCVCTVHCTVLYTVLYGVQGSAVCVGDDGAVQCLHSRDWTGGVHCTKGCSHCTALPMGALHSSPLDNIAHILSFLN